MDFDPMKLLGTVTGFMSQGTPARISQQLGPWIRHLTLRAGPKWAMFMLVPQQCFASRCRNDSIAYCEVCGDPACLHHSFASADGRVACASCVYVFSEAAEEEREADEPDVPTNDYQWAFGELRLPDTATWAEVQHRFRQLALKWHPDRHADATKKKRDQVQARFSRITAAYHALEKQMRSAA